MTNEELKAEWQKYGVELDGKVFPLKEKYVVCWGWVEDWGGLLFDVGDWSGECGVFITDADNNLISVNPQNHQETMILGKLVKLNPA
jgi:hypothetical protein